MFHVRAVHAESVSRVKHRSMKRRRGLLFTLCSISCQRESCLEANTALKNPISEFAVSVRFVIVQAQSIQTIDFILTIAFARLWSRFYGLLSVKRIRCILFAIIAFRACYIGYRRAKAIAGFELDNLISVVFNNLIVDFRAYILGAIQHGLNTLCIIMQIVNVLCVLQVNRDCISKNPSDDNRV